MKAYYCATNPTEKRFAYVSDFMSPVGAAIVRGVQGQPIMLERNEPALTMHIDESKGGLELPDLVCGLANTFIVRRSVAETMAAELTLPDHEVLPVILMNSKDRVHSDDYVVLNLIGSQPGMDPEQSDMNPKEDFVLRFMGKFTIKGADWPGELDLFRLHGQPVGFIFSERLVQLITREGWTNFKYKEVPVT